MKRIILTSAAMLLLAASPAMAMSCGGGGKGGMICGKAGGMAMRHEGTKGGCCREGMPQNMTKRG